MFESTSFSSTSFSPTSFAGLAVLDGKLCPLFAELDLSRSASAGGRAALVDDLALGYDTTGFSAEVVNPEFMASADGARFARLQVLKHRHRARGNTAQCAQTHRAVGQSALRAEANAEQREAEPCQQ